MDVPKLAAANLWPPAVTRATVLFRPQFFHESAMVALIFAQILPR
ncbi:hypothetical protein [Rhizobium sp. BK456]|nr:hypothetical protein [Rhizobium sp. BK456]MBB3524035.1 hypothetical protein [Rhizobium sp. BK456]